MTARSQLACDLDPRPRRMKARASKLAADEFLTGKRSKARGARKPEQRLNDKVVKALRSWDAVRVENAVGPGTPDVNYISGWIEDKVLRGWPAKADSPVKIGHYRPDQRAWHTKRRAAGGRVHVILEVLDPMRVNGDTVFVFDAADAALGLGLWTRDELFRRALLVMCPFDGAKLARFITACDSDRH